jgi:endonuclease/exonuclease/phosphatase family metal-dependent hydrolase
MESFYELYLKYKLKYLNLKKNKQKGGKFDYLIDIVSFNVLNPDFNYSVYLFKNYSEQIKQIYQNKITNKELNLVIKNLVKIERKEFELYRKTKLLIIIKSWINAGQIVCLQEVNNQLLETLIKIYGTQLISTQDVTTLTNIDDHRLVIVPKSYQIVKTDKLTFDNGLKVKECLIVNIKDANNKEFVIFNLHIHWKSKESDYSKFAKLIKNYIELTYLKPIPFIICGDFNSSINSLFMTNFIKEINETFKLDTNSSAYSDDYTSSDTKNKNTLSWIDHILSHNLIAHAPTQTTNKIEHFEIFYNGNQVIEYIVNLNKSTIKTKEFKATKDELKIFNSSNFVSDHKPVFASFTNISY